MESLANYLNPDLVLLDVEASNVKQIFEMLSSLLIRNAGVSEQSAENLKRALNQREDLGSTYIGEQLAIPHAYVDGIPDGTIVFCRLAAPIQFASDQPVRLVFLLTGSESSRAQHVKLLAKFSRLLRDRFLVEDLLNVSSAEEFLSSMQNVEQRHK